MVKTEWDDPMHIGKSIVSMYDALSELFHVEFKKENPDIANLSTISKSAGYLAQQYGNILRNYNFNRRLKDIEAQVRVATPEDLILAKNPAIIAEKEMEFERRFA